MMHRIRVRDELGEDDDDDVPMMKMMIGGQQSTDCIIGNYAMGRNGKTVVKEVQQRESQYAGDQRVLITANWLINQVDLGEHCSMARQDLFDAYLQQCQQLQQTPVNQATFGKIVRALFPSVTSRRLGMRGHSKYHYYGMGWRSSEHSSGLEIRSLTPEQCSQLTGSRRSRLPSPTASQDGVGQDILSQPEAKVTKRRPVVPRNINRPRTLLAGTGMASSNSMNRSMRDDVIKGPSQNTYQPLIPNYEEFRQYLEPLMILLPSLLPAQVTVEQMACFSLMYQQHCVNLLQLIAERQFGKLTPEMIAAAQSEEGLRLIGLADDYLYQVVISVLVSDMLETVPIQVTQAIRQFAKTFESSLQAALRPIEGLSPALQELKLQAGRRLGQVLRRRTSLNHLAQAVRSVLSNCEHVTLMLHDWSHVDLAGIREQVDWLIGSGGFEFWSQLDGTVRSLLLSHTAKSNLDVHPSFSLQAWLGWCEQSVEGYFVGQLERGVTLEEALRTIQLRSSHLLTMLIRDLTLRSAGTFGSFHLLRMLMDEWLMAWSERKMDESRRMAGLNGLYSTIRERDPNYQAPLWLAASDAQNWIDPQDAAMISMLS